VQIVYLLRLIPACVGLIMLVVLRHSGRAVYLYSTALKTQLTTIYLEDFLHTSLFPNFLPQPVGGFINNILRGLLLIRNKLRCHRSPRLLILSFLLITSGEKQCIVKSGLTCCLYCTKSGLSCFFLFPTAFAYNLHSPPANGKQGPILEVMSQTLLTNKNQENLD
jgi:hypothetical protein